MKDLWGLKDLTTAERLSSNDAFQDTFRPIYRGISLIRKRISLGPYRRTLPRVVQGS